MSSDPNKAEGPATRLGSAIDSVLSEKESSTDYVLKHLLSSVRERMDFEVSFISEFVDDHRVFRYVESKANVEIISVGASNPLDESYCKRIVDGTLPELICNAQDNLLALQIEATRAVPVGSHVSVPLKFSDGRVFGTFCGFSRVPNYSLCDKDLGFMRVFADIAAIVIEQSRGEELRRKSLHEQIRALVHNKKIDLNFQPIFDVNAGRTVGYECLCRTRVHFLPIEKLFQQATAIGLGGFLDSHIITKGLEYLRQFEQGQYLSCNVSPGLACTGELAHIFSGIDDLSNLVLEITEHDVVRDYSAIGAILAPLRSRGARLAVDDAGAGYASLRHILLLKPDIIKLDISLIRNINRDSDKQALASALVEFSHRCKYQLIAEGVETREELRTLRHLGVTLIQGYLVSKPYPFAYFSTWETPALD
ncbi:EAL domain-containing protein [Teredinibacter turnerae]|uniref:sensor domain-containing phosphodiesterase n=1 Tax=Teredinibacter turnerae TaxID=2426 RepID=UPI00036EA9E9|nr:EAL domain-containing protein [Teredinibacter turnerae]